MSIWGPSAAETISRLRASETPYESRWVIPSTMLRTAGNEDDVTGPTTVGGSEMGMNDPDHIETLRQRRNWLTARIKAKESVGWEVIYDTRERDALSWMLDKLAIYMANGSCR